jgi:hypothetical protein
MAAHRRSNRLRLGDRARSKITRRVGTIWGMPTVHGRRQYDLSYDEQPQDAYLATPAQYGARLARELLEPS